MHEYSIVASIIDRVQREATLRGGTRVHRLHLSVGELSGVEIDLLKTAFETFRERTICEGAELSIDAVAASWSCPQCERAIASGAVLYCKSCKRPARMTQGDEIVLQRIEMEAPHV